MSKLIKDRKTLYMILGVVLFSVFSLTIVYAALSVTLNITGNSEVVASTWDIHLDNVKVTSGSVSGSAPTITSSTTASFSTTLNNPGDFYEFTIDVVNDGSIDAMIGGISKTPNLSSEQAKYLNYIVEYQNGESINTKQLVSKNSFVRLKVRVEFRKDITVSDLPTTSETLNLAFAVNYVQSDGNGSGITNNGMEADVSIVSGDGTQLGDEVCIKEECFYVMYSDATSVTMLAKYNLYVGGENINGTWTAYGDEATGRQDSTMLGLVQNQTIRKGTTAFSSTSQKGTNYSDYSGSIVEVYVKNYNIYLITQGVAPIESRLITKDELISLGCSEDDSNCSGAPNWIYATSYWSGSPSGDKYLWYVNNHSQFSKWEYFAYSDKAGVRPVITISRDLINSAGSSATKQLIEFTIEGTTYQAEEGMTWGEWVNSGYNTGGFIFDDWGGFVSNGEKQLYECVKSLDVINSSILYTYMPNGLVCRY